MRGPIDYIIVGFQGNKFDGSILSSLESAIDSNVIKLVALSFITKDSEGTVVSVDIADSGDQVITTFAEKYSVDPNGVDSDDIDEVAEILENNSSAGLLVIEHLWALPFKKALIDANGVLLAEGRIHPDAANELNEEGEA